MSAERAVASEAGATMTRAPLHATTALRVLALIALLVLTGLVPGFYTAATMLSLLTTMSFLGVVAVGMTFITISGNVMSFSLGATAAASSMAYVVALNFAGIVPGVVAGLAVGAAVSGVQGFVVGWLRANPIIVTIAGGILLAGIVTGLSGNVMLYPDAATGYRALRGSLFGVPSEFVVFVAAAALGEVVLRLIRIGRDVLMVGASFRAAEAAGIRTTRATLFAFAFAGALAGLAGVMLATRYGQASMGYGIGYDYNAIAAVLVGGTAISGGQGSLLRTFIGLLIVSVAQTLLLLAGLGQEWQALITGAIVLGVIMLQTKIGRG